MADLKTCGNCRFFAPKVHAAGHCRRPWSANARFWPSDLDKGDIFVHVTFGCIQFEEATDFRQETV